MKYLKLTLCLSLIISIFTFCSKDDNSITPDEPSDNTNNPPVLKKGNTYYVAPSGSDNNRGTIDKPWKTLDKVTKFLTAGDTAIFEDGDYYEDDVVSFANSGKEGSPIVVKARNKHKARIIFNQRTQNTQKIKVISQSYIEIRDLAITQEGRSTTTTQDIYIYVHVDRNTQIPSTNCSFVGNKIYKGREEGVKVYKARDILIKDNEIFDFDHEGIDVMHSDNVVIEGNKTYDIARVGIMVKGGARNVKVFNNIIENKTGMVATHGITIGGVSDHISTMDNSGYEGYNIIAWNNVIVAKHPGKISYGISFIGAKDCHAYNNVIIGTTNAFYFSSPNAIANRWTWNPTVDNPKLRNNIMMNVSSGAFRYNSPEEGANYRPENLDSDYNLYYNVLGGTPSGEKNSIYSKDPLFNDLYNDWKLLPGSPAIGKGFPLPETFSGYNRTIKIDFHTFDNKPRGNNWNMGVY